MINSIEIAKIDELVRLLKSNIKKIDKRLDSDAGEEQKKEIKAFKKKETINNKTKYIIFSAASVAIFLLLFYFSLCQFDFSVKVPYFKNPFEGEDIEEYDLVNF